MKQKLAGILLLAAVILAAGGYAVYSVKSEATVLDGYLGGEKIGLFEDAQVQKILKKKYHVKFEYSKAGSLDMVTADQAKVVVKDDGSLDYESLGKIISEKETASAKAKEEEIANNSTNPGGGSATGGNGDDKTEAEKVAENIGKSLAGVNESAKSIVESYML